MAVTGLNNTQFLNQSVKPAGGELKNINDNMDLFENGAGQATRTSQDFSRKKFQLPEINSAQKLTFGNPNQQRGLESNLPREILSKIEEKTSRT